MPMRATLVLWLVALVPFTSPQAVPPTLSTAAENYGFSVAERKQLRSGAIITKPLQEGSDKELAISETTALGQRPLGAIPGCQRAGVELHSLSTSGECRSFS